MSKHLQRDLEAIERDLLALSSMTEDMIDKACFALMQHRLDVAAEVIKFDALVDEKEVRLEEECLKVLALHQPVATDLRRTAAILKINNDLERIADQAVNIAERAERMLFDPGFEIPETLGEMAKHARAMVSGAIDCFVKQDVKMARAVCAQDDVLDNLLADVVEHLQQVVQRRPETIELAFHLFAASRQLERIGDHATNIAEDVIYMVEGEIARHKHTTIN
jgi:phosphate transport system protein